MAEALAEKSFSMNLLPRGTEERGPKYAKVKASLRWMIREKQVPVGTFLPSEKILATNFGVSSITIKRALNDLASEGLLERKQGVGTFVTDPSVRPTPPAVAEPSIVAASDAVLFLACGQSPKAYFDLLSGVERLLAANDNVLLYSSIEESNAVEAERLRRLIRRNSVRVLLIAGRVNDSVARFIKSLGPPVIYIGNYPITETVSQVCADVRSGARQATEMLLDSGVKRLGLLNGARRYGSAIEMARAFEEVMEEQKARVEHWQVKWVEREMPAQEMALKLLEDLQTPAGVLVEGGLEYEFLLAASKLRRRIPADLHVIICDPPRQRDTGRQSTRFESDWDKELPAAINKLWQLLVGQAPGTAVRFCFPMRFVAGDSL